MYEYRVRREKMYLVLEAYVKTVTQVCRACADDGVGAEGTVL